MSIYPISTNNLTEDLGLWYGFGTGSTGALAVAHLLGHPFTTERLSVLFRNPLFERAFLTSLAAEHDQHHAMGLLISAGVGLAFVARGSFVTWGSKIVLTNVILCIFGVFAWVAFSFVNPRQAAQRRHVATCLTLWLHIATIPLPPFTYAGLTPPTSLSHAVLLIMWNARLLQPLFTIGVWTAQGFLGDLALLTGVMYVILHWNKDECQLLCALQPALGEYYVGLGKFLVRWLGTTYVAQDPVGMCLQVRHLLQFLIGFLVPVTLGYWREMKDRRAFACKYGVQLKPCGWRGNLFQVLIGYATVMFSIGIMTHIFMVIPALAELSVVLLGGRLATGEV